jgi:CRISPR-associated protein Cas5t
MNVIRFCVEGVFNSFRVPFFRTYHKSFLAPPKTTIIGMLVNIMREPESLYYKLLEKDDIRVSVIIDEIGGRAKDLWSYNTLTGKSDMHGRSVIRRDRLYKTKYIIYLNIPDKNIYNNVLTSLKKPKSVPYLGLDDEIIKLSNISEVEVVQVYADKESEINSVFLDKGIQYSVIIKDDSKWIELPTANNVPLKYSINIGTDDKRERREPSDEYKQIEYINCTVKVKGTKIYKDGNNRMVFY